MPKLTCTPVLKLDLDIRYSSNLFASVRSGPTAFAIFKCKFREGEKRKPFRQKKKQNREGMTTVASSMEKRAKRRENLIINFAYGAITVSLLDPWCY